MKKNGFIATSILYSIFLVFLTLFLALILAYLHNQILLQKINDEAKSNLLKINNTKISDLNIGDYVQFMNDPSMGETYNNPDPARHDPYEIGESVLNQEAKWIVADIKTNGNIKTYYFLSEIDASKLDVQFKLSTDVIRKYHTLTIGIINEMINLRSWGNENLYQQSLQFKNYTSFKMGFPTSTELITIRNNTNLTDEVKNSIFGIDSNYIVYIDQTTGPYTAGNYYYYRMYNFTLANSKNGSILNNYCGGNFSNGKVNYNSNNTFGYMNKVWDTASNSEYIDYCSYASPVAYTHKVSDKVVEANETKDNDIAILNSAAYNFRLMLELGVDSNSNVTYVSGGTGLRTNPYIIMDGRKSE